MRFFFAQAYKNWLKKNGKESWRLPGINFTSEQLFYIGFGQVMHTQPLNLDITDINWHLITVGLLGPSYDTAIMLSPTCWKHQFVWIIFPSLSDLDVVHSLFFKYCNCFLLTATFIFVALGLL